ncbi:MAG: AAA family ATPase [Pontibacterium sp.]
MLLIESLSDASAYSHSTTDITFIETHISWLFLTGDYAYKVKKPVNFGFLNFTTLERRKHYCEEELRLNQRLAPDIYLEIVEIRQHQDQIFMGGDQGAVIEYAVKMTQFNNNLRLDVLLEAHRFEAQWIDELASHICDFHQRIPLVASDSPWGEPETILGVVQDNFSHIDPRLISEALYDQLKQLEQHYLTQFEALTPLIKSRKADGHIRECHGDLHLANITLFNDSLRLFDCIEFNLQFRWIDTLSDLAFLLMDLEANGQFRWANRCLNRYLELGGDYNGLPLLNFYKAYRSMVRAKVAMLGEEKDHFTFERYLTLTNRYAQGRTPAIYIMHGVSGTGKSYLSQQLVDATGAIRIRSDVERKRIYKKLSKRGNPLELYGSEMNAHTFNYLLDTTRTLLEAGYPVIVDATFIRERARTAYIELSKELNINLHIIACVCEPNLIRARLKKRAMEGNDASDATVQVMEQQHAHLQHLNEEEQAYAIEINTDDDEAVHKLLEQLDCYPDESPYAQAE